MSQSQSRLVTDCPKYFHCVLHCWEYFMQQENLPVHHTISIISCYDMAIADISPRTSNISNILTPSPLLSYHLSCPPWCLSLMFEVRRREVRGESVLTAQLQERVWWGPWCHWTLDWLTDWLPGLSFLSSPALTANIYQDQADPGNSSVQSQSHFRQSRYWYPSDLQLER